MRIEFIGDSLTAGSPGCSFLSYLRELMPGIKLQDRGKPGDTVISLHRRIAHEARTAPAEIAVVWIGVNDVFSKLSFSHGLLKRLTRQPRARDLEEFRNHYIGVIELLRERAPHIVTVSPFLIGERISNSWNMELLKLGRTISSVSAEFAEVHHLDLRSRLTDQLELGHSSDYLPTSIARIGLDLLFARTSAQVDRMSTARGLVLTLDGVHLNSQGARWVAEQIDHTIRPLLGFQP